MQRQYIRPTSGAKAVAIDNRATLARYRFYQLITLLTLVLSAGFALGLHILLGR